MPDLNTDPVMPFGKHKGSNASDIPVEYLDWLIGQEWLRPAFKAQLEAHLATRPDWKRMDDE